jgi:hypothetical protein
MSSQKYHASFQIGFTPHSHLLGGWPVCPETWSSNFQDETTGSATLLSRTDGPSKSQPIVVSHCYKSSPSPFSPLLSDTTDNPRHNVPMKISTLLTASLGTLLLFIPVALSGSCSCGSVSSCPQGGFGYCCNGIKRLVFLAHI